MIEICFIVLQIPITVYIGAIDKTGTISYCGDGTFCKASMGLPRYSGKRNKDENSTKENTGLHVREVS